MQDTLRVGVVGVGYLGRFHAQKYAALDNTRLVGVVDIDRRRAEEIAAECGTRAFSDHRDLMSRVDAVSIVVPTPQHFAVGRDFLINDVDVLIEKPITTRLDEADELIELAERRGRILQVGHLERFNPAVVALADIVKVPRFIESHRLSLFTPRATDVSVVLDLMIHDIDIILNFVGSGVRHLNAAGIAVISSHVDIANARLEFHNGCVANVTASRLATRNERKIRLFQKDAYISVDFANHEITVVQPRENGSSDPAGAGPGPIPGLALNRMCFTKSDALQDEIAAFVDCVRRRREPQVSGRTGRDALHIALSIMDQIDSTNRRHAV